MVDPRLKELIELTCNYCIDELEKRGKLKPDNLNSFTRTERILYMYNLLEEGSKEKQLIDNALEVIKDDDYYGIIEERYFNNLTFEHIAEIYDVKTQTISRQRRRLVRILSKYIFPNEVVKEILEG